MTMNFAVEYETVKNYKLFFIYISCTKCKSEAIRSDMLLMDHRKGLTKAEPEEAQIETINFDLLL